MLHKGLDYHTVKVTCKNCGWFRNIAHAGLADGKRALVKIQKSKDPSHVLHARVIEISDTVPEEVWREKHLGYVDLVAEAHEKGLIKAMNQYSFLLNKEICPRCKKESHLALDQIWNLGSHVRY